MPGLLDFGNDELPSLLGGNNSIIWGNRMRGSQANDGMPALWQSIETALRTAPPLPEPRVLREANVRPHVLREGGSPPPPSAPSMPNGGLLGNYDEAPQGLLAGLQETMTDPLFLTGLGLLSGEGFGGAMRGAHLGMTFQDRRRQQAEQRRMNDAAQSFFSNPANLEGLPPGAVAGLRSLGPEGLKSALDILAKGHVTPLDRKYKESQIAANNARAGYYRDGGASRTGQTERIVERLMQSNPDLSYEEAVALARRAPQDDSLRLERLALDAYRNDPSRDLEEWRSFYGVGARPQPSQLVAPTASGGQPRSAENEQALATARKAIENGAPRDAVIKRLRDAGIDPSGL